MKALTLWQPWASLCVEDAGDGVPFKTIETRSWKAPDSLIGERIAIHAAARKMPLSGLEVGPFEAINGNVVRNRDVTRSLTPEERLLAAIFPDGHAYYELPLGAVLGTVRLADCVPIETPESDEARGPRMVWTSGAGDLKLAHFTPDDPEPDGHPWRTEADIKDQLPFGDFRPGRWAWLLEDADKFAEPIPARGRQRLWNWEDPR